MTAPPQPRRTIAAIAAGLLVTAHPSCAVTPTFQQDAHGCRVIVPADLGTGQVRWIGGCERGAASGAGVLRVDRGKGDVALFAGTMRGGRPVAGWLDTGAADTAGPSLNFNGADGLPTDGQSDSREACAIASAGAKAASDRLRRAGNGASASFYERWSRTLQRCLTGAE